MEEERKTGTGAWNTGVKAKKTARAFDRQHWTDRIGISPDALKEPAFRAEYPFESHFHLLGRLNYHYIDEGEGEPVVMVHGNPTWSFFYRKLILGLKGNYRCLAADHIGCGLSEKPQKYTYTLDQHILNLERWLEATLPPASWAGGKINLIVHDWGGPIGLGYAVRHPERIKRVVLMNTSAFVDGDMPFGIKLCRWPILGPIIVRGLNLFAGEATVRTTVTPMAKAVKDGFLLPYNSWRNRVGVYRFVKDIPLRKSMPTYKTFKSIEGLLGSVMNQVPVLVQWGMKDWCFTPFFLNLWRKRYPRAEVDEYAAGHYLLEDAGDAILARIRSFLERPVE